MLASFVGFSRLAVWRAHAATGVQMDLRLSGAKPAASIRASKSGAASSLIATGITQTRGVPSGKAGGTTCARGIATNDAASAIRDGGNARCHALQSRSGETATTRSSRKDGLVKPGPAGLQTIRVPPGRTRSTP